MARADTFERRRLDVVAGLGGLAVLVACAIVVRDGTVGSLERSVFEAINGLPEVLEPPMRLAQFLGVLVVGPIVAIVALVLRRWRLALAAVLVTIGKLAAERTVWHYVSRQRPGVTEPNAIVRGGTATSGAAFVSGHVILVTALAWVITPYLRGRGGSRRGSSWPRGVRPHLPRRPQPARRDRRPRAGGRCGCAANLIVAVPVRPPLEKRAEQRPGPRRVPAFRASS